MPKTRLFINIDHVATLRNARGGYAPDPVRFAKQIEHTSADGITVHLREDRRHIKDIDVYELKEQIKLPLNLEIAATPEMLNIAIDVKPNYVCIVPEKRNEITTEGGLDVVRHKEYLKHFIEDIHKAGSRVSLFVSPEEKQIEAAYKVGADIVEIHTGTYCNKQSFEREFELTNIKNVIKMAHELNLECHAGHGLSYSTVGQISKIKEIKELNIGHFIIGEALFLGIEGAIEKMRELIDQSCNSQ